MPSSAACSIRRWRRSAPRRQAQAFVERLAALTRATGLPLRLSEVGIGPEHLDLLASEAMKQERLLINNPCPISEADARRLYEAAL